MNSAPPKLFARRIQSHNRHVVLGALLALLSAAALWVGAFHAGKFAILGYQTIIQEDHTESRIYPLIFCGVMILLLGVVLIQRAWRPYRRLKERAILGWHVLPELLLLPASLALAVSDNLAAYRPAGFAAVSAAWEVLCGLARTGKLPAHKVSLLGLPDEVAQDALLTLQFAGLVDLHQGKDGWFYRIRSAEEQEVKDWIERVNSGGMPP